MISQAEVFKRVLSEINAAGIEYMIVGSLAASAHGFMRDTHDLDLVVIMDKEAVRSLAASVASHK
jgi:tRNA nucleotidyltransferase (CCA-adding enzyme)